MNNISRVKIVFSILILVSALTASYFMIFSSLPSIDSDKKNIAENFNNPLANVKNPINWQESKTNGVSGQLAGDFSDVESQFDENNFTKNLIQKTFDNVQTGDFTNNNQKIQDKIISNNEKFDFSFIKSINDAEIKISSDNSKEAKVKYLKALEEVSKKNEYFKKSYLEIMVDVYQKLDSSSAKEATVVYNNLAADYLNVEVPGDWKDFHKKLIIYFKNAAILYKAMAQYQQDPIKGYLALEKVDEIITQKVLDLKKSWDDKYKEVGI